jgi:hypothetical protein
MLTSRGLNYFSDNAAAVAWVRHQRFPYLGHLSMTLAACICICRHILLQQHAHHIVHCAVIAGIAYVPASVGYHWQ